MHAVVRGLHVRRDAVGDDVCRARLIDERCEKCFQIRRSGVNAPLAGRDDGDDRAAEKLAAIKKLWKGRQPVACHGMVILKAVVDPVKKSDIVKYFICM